MRIFIGQSGQVSALFSFSGGAGMISIWVTERAPWRFEVPMQSEPVSPPPMTTTCLPPARMGVMLLSGSPVTRWFCWRQEIHGEMDAIELAARDRQVARLFGAAGEGDGVVLGRQFLDGDVLADMDAGVERDALGLHLLDAPVDDGLVELEVGDAVAHQAADLGGLFIKVHIVAGAGELLGAGHAGRARADDGDGLAGLVRIDLRA